MSQALVKGDELDGGRYRILQELGGGGEAMVYLAEDTGVMAKRWAIKEMRESNLPPAERAEAVKRFQAEASLLASLKHRNLPDVVRYFSDNGREYLVMEYVPGQTLEAVLKANGGPLPEPQVLAWAAQLCDVLEYLHTHQPPIIFRDLSPDNIILQQDGTIKLIDFGIARHFDPSKRTDTLKMGKIGYAPPEQYGGRGQTTPRSDIYALGATLHALLTDRDPSIQPFIFPLANTLNPQVSPAVSSVLAQAVEQNADARFASVADFRRALLGTGQLRFCPHCGIPNRGTSNFCMGCGGRLVVTGSTTPVPTETTRLPQPLSRSQWLKRFTTWVVVGACLGMILGALPALVTPGVSVLALPDILQKTTLAGMAFFGVVGAGLGMRVGWRR
ncbi:MAG: protein kinase [Herpetosiphonaceae bacterium]|nr:protein kinase [Herpetosiphonaceae bacterium]